MQSIKHTMERRAFQDEGKNYLLPTSNGKFD